MGWVGWVGESGGIWQVWALAGLVFSGVERREGEGLFGALDGREWWDFVDRMVVGEDLGFLIATVLD